MYYIHIHFRTNAYLSTGQQLELKLALAQRLQVWQSKTDMAYRHNGQKLQKLVRSVTEPGNGIKSKAVVRSQVTSGLCHKHMRWWQVSNSSH